MSGRRGTLAQLRAVPHSAALLWYGPWLTLSMSLGISLLIALPLAGYSSAVAGGAAGAVAAGRAVAAPMWGRQADRRGPRFAIGAAAAVHCATVGLFTVLISARVAAAVVLVMAGLTAATLPPVSEALRGTWARVTRGEAEMHVVTAAESVISETALLIGPLVLALAALLHWPWLIVAMVGAGGAVCAVMTARRLPSRAVAAPSSTAVTSRAVLPDSGVLPDSAEPAANPGPAGAERRWQELARLGPVTAAAALLLFGLAAFEVAISQHSRGANAGVLLALWALLSLTATLAYTRLRTGRTGSDTPWLLAFTAAGLLVPALSLSTSTITTAFVMTGLGTGPSLVALRSRMLLIVRPEIASESFAWIGVAGTLAASAGTAVAGLLQRAGELRVLALTLTVAVALATAAAWLAGRQALAGRAAGVEAVPAAG